VDWQTSSAVLFATAKQRGTSTSARSPSHGKPICLSIFIFDLVSMVYPVSLYATPSLSRILCFWLETVGSNENICLYFAVHITILFFTISPSILSLLSHTHYILSCESGTKTKIMWTARLGCNRLMAVYQCYHVTTTVLS
jgi:hypothetical protein